MPRSAFSQIAPRSPRVVGIDYIAVPSPIPAIGCPVITAQPVDASVSVGQTAVFTVVATSIAPISYQWEISMDGGQTWNDITPGAPYFDSKTASLSVGPATSYMTGLQFRATVTADGCSDRSDESILTVES